MLQLQNLEGKIIVETTLPNGAMPKLVRGKNQFTVGNILTKIRATFELNDDLLESREPHFSNAYYKYVDGNIWNKVKPYLIPENLPMKKELDHIFTSSRAILSITSMKKAGFIDPKPRKFTHLIVTSHPKMPGYIVKTYLDAQRYYKEKPEWHYWIKRIHGAEAIREYIVRNKLEKVFKVPKKWIYAIPTSPSPPSGFLRKNFILVEEDMNLLSKEENEKMWKSEKVTPELLAQVYFLLEELGLHDCAKPDNIPFSKDGRIAFIDTQSHHEWPVAYKKMTPYLSNGMKEHWKHSSATESITKTKMDRYGHNEQLCSLCPLSSMLCPFMSISIQSGTTFIA